MVSASSTAGVSRKLFACVSSASSASTSWCNASSPPHASARYGARRLAGKARAPREYFFQAWPVVKGQRHVPWILPPAGGGISPPSGSLVGSAGVTPVVTPGATTVSTSASPCRSSTPSKSRSPRPSTTGPRAATSRRRVRRAGPGARHLPHRPARCPCSARPPGPAPARRGFAGTVGHERERGIALQHEPLAGVQVREHEHGVVKRWILAPPAVPRRLGSPRSRMSHGTWRPESWHRHWPPRGRASVRPEPCAIAEGVGDEREGQTV